MRVVLLLLLALVALVNGHGRLSVPTTRDMQNNQPTYKQNEPVPLASTKHRCRDLRYVQNAATYAAGSTTRTEWILEAAHPGDCFFYLSDGDQEEKWFKIAQIRDCHLIRSFDLNIPGWVPAGKYILRWEWYALQQVVNVEHYVQCADIMITGGSGNRNYSPVVTIPGHLPADAGKYRKVYEPGAPFFFTGPAVATPGNGPNPSPSSSPQPPPGASPSPNPPPPPPPPGTPAQPTGLTSQRSGNQAFHRFTTIPGTTTHHYVQVVDSNSQLVWGLYLASSVSCPGAGCQMIMDLTRVPSGSYRVYAIGYNSSSRQYGPWSAPATLEV